jgi:predicted transposase/invertase (TIGR01784 family)
MGMGVHDALFYRVFSDAGNAACLLQCVLPPLLVAAIDWSTLTLQSSLLVGTSLEKRQGDLLYSVRLRDHDVTPLVLIEHKSEQDPGAADRGGDRNVWGRRANLRGQAGHSRGRRST